MAGNGARGKPTRGFHRRPRSVVCRKIAQGAFIQDASLGESPAASIEVHPGVRLRAHSSASDSIDAASPASFRSA